MIKNVIAFISITTKPNLMIFDDEEIVTVEKRDDEHYVCDKSV